MTWGRLVRRGPPLSYILLDTKETHSFDSRTPPTSTIHVIPTTSLGTATFLAWYIRCLLLLWRCLYGPPQVGALLDDYPNILARANSFDNKLTSDALAITPQNGDYANILALSVRQLFGNIELTAGWDGLGYVQDDVMAFLRGT